MVQDSVKADAEKNCLVQLNFWMRCLSADRARSIVIPRYLTID